MALIVDEDVDGTQGHNYMVENEVVVHYIGVLHGELLNRFFVQVKTMRKN